MNELNILDHGFVRLVDRMGSDGSITEAARVSMSKNFAVKKSSDSQLLNYMMKNNHSSPFEFAEVVLHIKCPIFVARQWMRHRTWSYSEVSGRYSELPEEVYIPTLSNVNLQSTNNKQGRGEVAEESIALAFVEELKCDSDLVFDTYRNYVSEGIAKELCRINLPLNTYTEFYAKVDLNNLFKFLKLRLDPHAQYEIRVYAEAIVELIKDLYPISFKAFEDYTLNSETISSSQIEFLSSFLSGFASTDWIEVQIEDSNLSKSEKLQLKRILGV